MKILFTNNTLGRPAGTELAIRDLCREMRRRGHEVAAYSTQWGEIAETLIAEGVPVLDDPAQAPWTPDVIHGHHQWETTIAALRWHDRPVLSFCRGIESWHEAPCLAPNVAKWIAIDEPCAHRLISREGVPAGKVRLILNGIDPERFRSRQPLPGRPASALLFSNYATPDKLLPEVVQACRAEGLHCEAIGTGVRRGVEHPEEALGQFDIVFAKGKAALEAIFTGCAVIVCDIKGLGPMVTPENFEALRRQSFGYPCMTEPVTPEAIQSRIQEWDPLAAMTVQSLAREDCGIHRMFDALESLYQEVCIQSVTHDTSAWTDFASAFFAGWGSNAKLGRELRDLHRQTSHSEAPETAFDSCREHHRIRDAYRKGQAARAEIKAQLKTSGRQISPPIAKPRRRFMGLFN